MSDLVTADRPLRTGLLGALMGALILYAGFIATTARADVHPVALPSSDVTATSAPTVPSTPAPRTAAEFQAMFDRLSGGWAGGDGAASVVLPDHRTLWLFGDTMIGRPAATGRGYAPGAHLVRNSFVLQDGSDLHPVNGPGGREVLANRDVGSFSWPTAAIVDGGSLLVFASRTTVTGTGALGFAQLGTDVVTLDLPGNRDPIVRARTSLPPTDGTTSPAWGQALVRSGGWVYIYGTRSDPRPLRFGKELYVARARPGHVADVDSWHYHDGHGFRRNASAARALIGAQGGVSTTLSVVVAPDGRATVVSKRDEFLGTHVQTWTAPTPAGPFRAARSPLFAAPSGRRPGELLYLAEAHPQFTLTGGQTLVTVSRNNTDLNAVLADRLLFRPQFHAVPLPR